MNKGNFESIMRNTTTPARSHTTPKRTLRWDDPDVDCTKCSVKNYRDFLEFLNQLDTIDSAEFNMTSGKWSLFYAILTSIGEVTTVNYCLYENPHGIVFDKTCHSISDSQTGRSYKSSTSRSSESDADKLIRFKYERDQLNLKIEALVAKRDEVNKKIQDLVYAFIGDDSPGAGA